MTDSQLSILVKILALVFGGLCVSLAFLADILGTGVLQASLTIFGVVGGPLLGLFTLGVLFRRVEQKGALSGFILGLCFVSWIGFGGPKPPPNKLQVSVSNCTEAFIEDDNMSSNTQDSVEYFYLYRISYAWTSAIGFLVTVIVGVIVSEFVNLVSRDQSSEMVDPSLLAKCIRNDKNQARNQFRLNDSKEEEL